MILTPDGAGGFRANGGKYYIGNGNLAGMVSVFGRRADLDGPEGYVFFAADSQHPAYHLAQNVVASRRSPTCGRGLTDAYARLVAMKLFADRAIDYFRSAGPDDRRYLLFNPLTKMKVTTEGERVIDGLWDVIAVKGFEKDTYFEMAARDMRSLPKLEGTVHVNMALVLKFMANYLLNPAS
jgi:alkylation response protein AidB-like acyl-CoA dehydrogenase